MSTNDELTNFVANSRAAGKTDETINAELLSAGWREDVVLAAMLAKQAPGVPQAPKPTIAEYAGFWNRVAASCADTLIVSAIFFLIMIPLTILQVIGVVTSEEVLSIIVLLLSLIITVAYYPYMEAKKGYTFGKKFIGIHVAKDSTGDLLTMPQSLGRFFGKILSAIPLGIGFLMAGFTKKKQGLHDMLVGAVVLKTDRVNKYRNILTIVIAILGPSLFVIFAIPFLMALMFGLFVGGVGNEINFDSSPSEPSFMMDGVSESQWESEVSPQFIPSEETVAPVSLSNDELDTLFATTSMSQLVNIFPEYFSEGFVLSGPAVIHWSPDWSDEILVSLPSAEDFNFSNYVTIDIIEVNDAEGMNVYIPDEDSGIVGVSEFSYTDNTIMRFPVTEIRRDWGWVTAEDMQQVSGVLRFEIPQETGETYERSFDFTLDRQPQ